MQATIPQVEGVDLRAVSAPGGFEINDGKMPFTISYQVIYSNVDWGPSPFIPVG
jgi:hypothetical protein